MGFALSTVLRTSFDDAVTRTREALAGQGFGVLTEIDMQAPLKAKLGEDMEQYLILGACNPSLAHREEQCGPPLGRPGADLGTVRQHRRDRMRVTFGGRPHQRRLPAPRLGGVHVGAGGEQLFDDCRAAAVRRCHQQRLAARHRRVRLHGLELRREGLSGGDGAVEVAEGENAGIAIDNLDSAWKP